MSANPRVGVLGGTFDPVHLGHLVVASHAHHELGLDTVVLVPTGQPWQKTHREVTDATDRVLMTELAVADDDRMRVSRVDVDRPGPTYSADTASDLRSELGPDAELFLLVGADALAGLPGWHEVDRLLAEVTVVGCARPGHSLDVPPVLAGRRVRTIRNTPIELSSSDVRERARTGAPIRYLVPDAVERHIRERGLYGASA